MNSLLRFLNVRGADKSVLALLAPVFALVTAVNVITISFSKALFIAHNPYSALPWMFIGGALFTMLVTLLFVSAMKRWTATTRLEGLLLLAAISYGGISAIAPLDPRAVSLIVFAWCAGIGSLLVIQVWSWSSTLLPTRQARRLFPITSAVATLGAAGGGALTRLVLEVGDMVTLMLTAGLLLLIAFGLVVRAQRKTPGEMRRARGTMEQNIIAEGSSTSGPSSAARQIPEAFKALRDVPLLGRLAILALLVQAASVVLDFQFSSALKHDNDASGVAGFLGVYYFGANILTLVVALFFASRLTRLIGIGLASSSAAVVLLAGAAVSLTFTGLGVVYAFWAVVGTSFVERVAGFGLAKQAMQAAQMPVPPSKSEPARFLIHGVFTRLAVVGVSVALMLFGGDLANYAALSPALLVLSLLALVVGFRLGSAYRAALLDALSDGRTPGDGEMPGWARVEAARIVSKLLRTGRVEGIKRGLALCQELRVPPPPRIVEQLLRNDGEPELVITTLEGLQDQAVVPRKVTVARLLHPDQPPGVLSGALCILPQEWTEFADLVRDLMNHPDESVRTRAVMWLRGSVLGPVTRQAIRKRVQTGMAGSPQRRFDVMIDPLLGTERKTGALTREFVSLVDRLPKLLRSDSEKMQRIALDLFVELALPEHAVMLIDSLDDASTRAIALIGLARMPADIVLPKVREHLDDSTQAGHGTCIRLLMLAERIGGEDGVGVLASHMASPSLPMRQQAVISLWHLAGTPAVSRLSKEVLTERVRAEVDDLVLLAVIDSALSLRKGENKAQLRTELALRRAAGEVRMFRLLALVYSRAAVDSAFAHYRSLNRRLQSNAIELLDTTITDPELRPVLHYVEGTEYRGGRSYTTSTGMMSIPAFSRILKRFQNQPEGDAVEALLAESDPWIYELYTWAARADSEDADVGARKRRRGGSMASPSHEEVMERLFLLRGIPLFDGVPADQLLPLAHVARRATFEEGVVIFEEDAPGDELFLVALGRVIIEHEGREVANLGPRECFGEMAILDEQPRSAMARAVEHTECLVVKRTDFDDLLDIAPGLARGVIRVLTRQLRETLDAT